jgi:phasin family protein
LLGSLEAVEAVSQASSVLARGLQEGSQECFRLFQQRLTKNIEGVSRFAYCRSPQHLIALQAELARENMQQTVEASRRLGQVSVRIADEANRIVQGRQGRTTPSDFAR